jgi:methionine synthase II (cobalamin-independent)
MPRIFNGLLSRRRPDAVAESGGRQEFPTHKELDAGVIDVNAFKAETAEDVAGRIRTSSGTSRRTGCDSILTAASGRRPRWIARQKLRALVDGARPVRQELAGR